MGIKKGVVVSVHWRLILFVAAHLTEDGRARFETAHAILVDYDAANPGAKRTPLRLDPSSRGRDGWDAHPMLKGNVDSMDDVTTVLLIRSCHKINHNLGFALQRWHPILRADDEMFVNCF